MKNDHGCLSISAAEGNIEHVCALLLNSRNWLLIKWKTTCKLVTSFPIKSSSKMGSKTAHRAVYKEWGKLYSHFCEIRRLNIIRKGVWQYMVFTIVRCSVTNRSWQFGVCAEDECQKLIYCVAVPVPILKHLKVLYIVELHCISLALLRWIFICFDPSDIR